MKTFTSFLLAAMFLTLTFIQSFAQESVEPEKIPAFSSVLDKINKLNSLTTSNYTKLLKDQVVSWDSTYSYSRYLPDDYFLVYKDLVTQKNFLGYYEELLEQNYDTSTAEWINAYIVYRTFYPNGTNIKSFLEYKWDTVANAWLDTPVYRVYYHDNGKSYFFQYFDTTSEYKYYYLKTVDFDASLTDTLTIEYKANYFNFEDSIDYNNNRKQVNTFANNLLTGFVYTQDYMLIYPSYNYNYAYKLTKTATYYYSNLDQPDSILYEYFKPIVFNGTYDTTQYYEKQTFVYNNNAQVLEKTVYRKDSLQQDWTPADKYVYIYDSSSNLDTFKVYTYSGTDWVLSYYKTYGYDTENRITEIVEYWSWETTKTLYDYDPSGHKIYEGNFYYDETDSVWYCQQEEKWSYNDLDFLSMYVYLYQNDTVLDLLDTVSYAYSTFNTYNYPDIKYEITYNNGTRSYINKSVYYYSLFNTFLQQYSADNLTIYPNPTSNYIYFQQDNIDLIEIYSLDGKLVKQKINISGNINISGLSPGQYIIKAKAADGKTFVAKFIKK